MTPFIALVIYDGNCGICMELKHFVLKNSTKKLLFIPYQDPNLSNYVKISKTLTENSMYLITSKKDVFKGARGILVLLTYLGGKKEILATSFLNLKINYILEPIYLIIAKFRGKLSTILGYNSCTL